MNFSFRTLRLGDTNKRCQLYSIVKEKSDVTEAAKFVSNTRNRERDDFGRLKSRLDNIKERQGARIEFFKPN